MNLRISPWTQLRLHDNEFFQVHYYKAHLYEPISEHKGKCWVLACVYMSNLSNPNPRTITWLNNVLFGHAIWDPHFGQLVMEAFTWGGYISYATLKNIPKDNISNMSTRLLKVKQDTFMLYLFFFFYWILLLHIYLTNRHVRHIPQPTFSLRQKIH